MDLRFTITNALDKRTIAAPLQRARLLTPSPQLHHVRCRDKPLAPDTLAVGLARSGVTREGVEEMTVVLHLCTVRVRLRGELATHCRCTCWRTRSCGEQRRPVAGAAARTRGSRCSIRREVVECHALCSGQNRLGLPLDRHRRRFDRRRVSRARGRLPLRIVFSGIARTRGCRCWCCRSRCRSPATPIRACGCTCRATGRK